MNNIEVVFFDLFFTLIRPEYSKLRNENDVLGVEIGEWEKYAEDDELYLKRATTNMSPQEIIEDIIRKMKIDINENDKAEILKLREERLKNSLMNVDSVILDVILNLKKDGKKICLISNADIIDAMHWDKSPLHDSFDAAIFSYKIGYLKPQAQIYKFALEKMMVKPENCIFIGDGGSDELRGAKKLGIKTVQTEYLLKRNERNEFADYYIDDFREIESILGIDK